MRRLNSKKRQPSLNEIVKKFRDIKEKPISKRTPSEERGVSRVIRRREEEGIKKHVEKIWEKEGLKSLNKEIENTFIAAKKKTGVTPKTLVQAIKLLKLPKYKETELLYASALVESTEELRGIREEARGPSLYQINKKYIKLKDEAREFNVKNKETQEGFRAWIERVNSKKKEEK